MKSNRLAWCFGLLFAASTCFGQMYKITDLGTLPGGGLTVGYGINASGQVTGYANTGNGFVHAFLYKDGKMTDLGTFAAGTSTIGQSINSIGQITGYATAPGFGTHAFLYSDGKMMDLGTLPGGTYSAGQSINDHGQVTGYSDSGTSAFNQHAFLYSNGTMSDLGTLPGGIVSAGYGINASGQVAGYAYTSANDLHAFLYSVGTMTDLGTSPGTYASIGAGINASGQVTGSSFRHTSSGGGQRAFLYSNGKMIDLEPLSGDTFTIGQGINSYGQVTGYSDTSGFLYSPGSGMIALRTVIPSGSGWSFLGPFAINDAGQMTGVGDIGNAGHAFLLTPIYKALVQQPIKANGSSVFKTQRGGLPVKFTLTKNDASTCTLLPATISITRTKGEMPGLIDLNSYTSNAYPSSSKLRPLPYFRTINCQYVYKLATAELGAGKYQVDINIKGIPVGHALFAIK